MKKGVGILLTVAFWLFLGSSALADCPDSTYFCHQNQGKGASVGTEVFGNCWSWSYFECRICGGDYSKPTKKCNESFSAQCQGQCWACAHYIDTGGVAKCYDNAGQCHGHCDSGM